MELKIVSYTWAQNIEIKNLSVKLIKVKVSHACKQEHVAALSYSSDSVVEKQIPSPQKPH